MYKWECSICGKQPEHFGIKEFAMSPSSILETQMVISEL